MRAFQISLDHEEKEKENKKNIFFFFLITRLYCGVGFLFGWGVKKGGVGGGGGGGGGGEMPPLG